MFLLDTPTFSEMRRPRPSPGVVAFFDSQPVALLYTSVLVVGEIRQGITGQQDQDYRQRLANRLDDEILPQFGERALPVTLEIADRWGVMRGEAAARGESLPPIDALIAATALVHGLIVVTRNEADFRRCGAQVRNPWNE